MLLLLIQRSVVVKMKKVNHCQALRGAPVNNACKQLRILLISCMKNININAWAHMIHMGKHASYDNPPDLPYFKKCSKIGSAAQPIVNQVVSSLSPAQRVQICSECIDQLSKLHSLLEKGGKPTEQYNALQKAIFTDIQNFQQK